MHIVLHNPEIPQNTGNIGRTCVATDSVLHLIEPLGFKLNEKEIKRSGMDYWEQLEIHRHINYEAFLDWFHTKVPAGRIFLTTTKAHRVYTEAAFGEDDAIVFGAESAGIPEEILVAHEKDCIRVPMTQGARSLNLSNTVAIVLYEALRQQGFAGLETAGELHRLKWEQADKIM